MLVVAWCIVLSDGANVGHQTTAGGGSANNGKRQRNCARNASASTGTIQRVGQYNCTLHTHSTEQQTRQEHAGPPDRCRGWGCRGGGGR